jgi:alpha-tubulin suppressor-like RCC1 family protein
MRRMTSLFRARLFATACLLVAGPMASQLAAATLAAGESHTVLVANGEVWSWGRNYYGQLGDGTQVDHPLPAKLTGFTGIVAVAAGKWHTLAIKSDGTVIAWGENSVGALGDGTQLNRTSPVAVLNLTGVIAIAAGGRSSLALKSDGSVWTWGLNSSGQLGDGSTTMRLSPVQVNGLSGIVAISAGDAHGVAVKSDGHAYGWGGNVSGQLGDGTTTTPRLTPVQVIGLSGLVGVAAGTNHTLFLKGDGTAFASGANGSGQLGDGSGLAKSTPVPIAGLDGAVFLAGGDTHSLAILDDGTIWAWGANTSGQLGEGTSIPSSIPVQTLDLTSIAAVAAGLGHNVAVTSDHTVWGWGKNDSGQVGDGAVGSGFNRHEPVKISESSYTWKVGAPVFSPPPAEYTSVFSIALSSATAGASIRYTTDGTDPTATSTLYSAPITPTVPTTFRAKAFKALLADSNVATGIYTFQVAQPTFTPAGGVFTSAQSITMGTTSPGASIRYTTDGSDPTSNSPAYTSPVPVGTMTTLKAAGFRTAWNPSWTTINAYSFNLGTLSAPVISPSAGTYVGSVVVTLTATSGSTIRYTTNGVDPTTSSTLYTAPVTLTASATLKAKAWKTDWTVSPTSSTAYTLEAAPPTFTPGGGTYAVGQTITLACATPGATIRYTLDGSDPTTSDASLSSGGIIFVDNFTLKARAWVTGMNTSAATSSTYVISGAVGTGSVAGGDSHSLALTPAGAVWSWGYNAYGQIGDGTQNTTRYSPVQVTSLSGILAIAAGAHHSLALKGDGTVWSWGKNATGQLGDGSSGNNRLAPVQVGTAGNWLTGVIAIAAGGDHSLALKSDGTLWAWGSNASGQIGDGTSGTNRLTPVQVGTAGSWLTGVAAIAAGASHSAAVKQDGTAYGWGLNSSGQVGDGTSGTNRMTPVQVSGLTGATAIAAGASHTVARKSDGSAWAWGVNGSGQLGNGSYTSSNTPVEVWGVSGVIVPRVGAGGAFSLTLQSDGAVRGWGWNSSGQLGIGTSTGSNVAVPALLPEIVAVSAGTTHGLAVAQDGSLWAWGNNANGQVGDGTTLNRSIPVKVADAGFAWKAATPVISPGSNTYSADQTVTLTTTTSGGTIRYTTDGSDPLSSSSQFSTPFQVTVSATVKAKTFKAGLADSNAVVATYVLKVSPPSLSPGGGSFGSPQSVIVNCATPSVTLRYTLNGADPTTTDPTVTAGGTVLLDKALTLKVKGWRSGWDASDTAAASLSFQVANPVLNPAGGAFASATTVTISDSTPGSVIHYAMSGLEPTEADPVVASGGTVVVAESTSLKAKCFRTGWTPSATTAGAYVLTLGAVANPTFSPAGGTFTVGQTVRIITTTPGAEIRYTLDGTDPTRSSPIFAQPITIGATTTIKALASRSDRTSSAVATATYTINDSAVAAPTLSLASGFYTTTRSVTMSDATSGAEIRYTTNGANPTTSDNLITPGSAINVDHAMVLKAAAFKTGMTPSAVTRRDYVITGAVVAGANHTAALKADGSVWAWGSNLNGQIGDGTSGNNRLVPVQVGSSGNWLTGVVALAAGASHTLALKADGSVWAWGYNLSGQLGDNSTTQRTLPVQVGIAGNWLTGVVAIAAGASHSMALKSNGTVYAWGANASGQVGDGTSGTNRLIPVQVSGLITATAIAAGQAHSLALKSDATVVAWGSNSNGQLGDGGTTGHFVPGAVTGLSGITAIGAGSSHSLAIRGISSGTRTVWAWGYNNTGQLGDGTFLQRTSPVRTGWAAVDVVGGDRHTLARGTDGFAWGWGANDNGQLGLGVATATERFARRVAKIVEPLSISCGTNHSVALMPDGSVSVWGYGGLGQMGDGSTTSQTQPQTIPGLTLVSNAWLTQDPDLDGLTNAAEYRLGSDPLLADTNGDGVSDGAAVLAGRSVTNADTDGDGLANADEIRLGTDPLRSDTDGDGTPDGLDCYPLDPTQSQCGTPNPNDHTGPTVTLTEPSNAVLLP